MLPLLMRQCVSKPEEIRFQDGINVWDDLYLLANFLKDEVCEVGTSYETDRSPLEGYSYGWVLHLLAKR